MARPHASQSNARVVAVVGHEPLRPVEPDSLEVVAVTSLKL
ncbi:MAG: hypothetical protein ABSG53_09835 [Thermoguttaceae bacterium]|jgi:hypothetical protein